MWDRLRAKHKVKKNEPSRSVNSMPALASSCSSSSMSSLMLDLLSRTSAVTVNAANITSSTDAANTGRPIPTSQTPLPTVTVSSSNDVTSSSVMPPASHRFTRQQRESILHYMPPLTCREAQSRPLSDSRFVLTLLYITCFFLVIAFHFQQFLGLIFHLCPSFFLQAM